MVPENDKNYSAKQHLINIHINKCRVGAFKILTRNRTMASAFIDWFDLLKFDILFWINSLYANK